MIISYARIFLLVVLPSLALAPWFALLICVDKIWVGEQAQQSPMSIQAVTTLAPDIKVSEFANRITALSSTVLLVFLALGSAALALGLVWKSGTGRAEVRRVRWVWLVWFALMAAGIVCLSPSVLALFGKDFNHRTIEQVSKALTRLVVWQFYISAIAATLAGTALAAAATCIFLQAGTLKDEKDKNKNEAAANLLSRRLDLVLFGTAAVLVAGIIAADTWSMWPSPLVAGKDTNIARELRGQGVDDAKPSAQKTEELKSNYSAFVDLKNGLLAIQSVSYVGGLVLTFVPAALALAAARRRLGVAVGSAFGMDQIFRVLALLSPILVGPIFKFLSIKLGLGN